MVQASISWEIYFWKLRSNFISILNSDITANYKPRSKVYSIDYLLNNLS